MYIEVYNARVVTNQPLRPQKTSLPTALFVTAFPCKCCMCTKKHVECIFSAHDATSLANKTSQNKTTFHAILYCYFNPNHPESIKIHPPVLEDFGGFRIPPH